ncbi:MAG: DoxX family protein [Salinivirgaceae bacterium]
MKTKKTVGWILTALVIIFFLFDSLGKLFGMDESVKATVELGYPADKVFIIGLILLVSTFLYAIPRTSIIGIVLLTAYLGGAVATNFRVGSPVFSHTLFPVYMGILAWAGLAYRNQNLIKFISNKL